MKREAIEAAGDLKDSILYESHVPPDDKNQDLIRVASPLITPIRPPRHTNTTQLKQAPARDTNPIVGKCTVKSKPKQAGTSN